LPFIVVRKRPTLTSFHPTPPGSSSLLQVSINSEEVHFVPQKAEPSLTQTRALAKVFGLSSVTLSRVDSKEKPVIASHLNDPYGAIKSFSGIGNLVERGHPYLKSTRAIFAPWTSFEERALSETSRPLIAFAITNTEPRKLGAAQKFAYDFGKNTIRVAIVTLPISFGTINSHKLDIGEIKSTLTEFDYVFVIGNHVLQMPTGAAPRLAASSRAVKYVRACIDGMMQIVWASTGPKTARSFRQIFPSGGLCLVGRGGNERTGSSDVHPIAAALRGMLNERLPTNQARRYAAIGPYPIIDSEATMRFVEDAAINSRDEVVTIQTLGTRQSITILAFGINPIARSKRRFEEFCSSLLRSSGFDITLNLEEDAAFGFLGKISLAVGFSFSDGYLYDTVRSVRFFPEKNRFILASYAPSVAVQDYCQQRDVSIFHYSRLDEFRLKLDRRKRP
jgi:hypothetical protein